MTGAGLTVCDLSPFYCETGGGIRTYHRARLDWFARQDRHQYVLVYPGPRSQVTRVGPSTTIVRVFGPRLTADPLGYRFSLGYRFVRDAIRDLRPDVLETGDPWLSGPIGLLLRHRGVFDGVLASFCHIDTMSTYIEPFFVYNVPTWTDNNGLKLCGGPVSSDRLFGFLSEEIIQFVVVEAVEM